MQFDYTNTPDKSKLPPFAASTIDAIWDARRSAGLSVQFLKKDGKLDEWSFLTVAARDAFTAKLGKPFAVSGAA